MRSYFEVRNHRGALQQIFLAILLAWILSRVSVPMRVVHYEDRLQLRMLGGITVMIPALVMATTLSDPAGKLLTTRSRKIALTRLCHLLGVAVCCAAVGSILQSLANSSEQVSGAAIGVLFVSASGLSLALFGRIGVVVLPTILLLLQFSTLPIPERIAVWRQWHLFDPQVLLFFLAAVVTICRKDVL